MWNTASEIDGLKYVEWDSAAEFCALLDRVIAWWAA
jgi:hypothetical protein